MEHGQLAKGRRALLCGRLTAALLGRSAAARLGRSAAALLTGLLLACVPAHADAPYMGVNTWYGFGAAIDEQTIVALTDAVVDRGLRKAGYRYVWLDAGWWSGAREANGEIDLNRSQWPHGMRWLTGYIHSRGLLAGIYTDIGEAACHNGGSLGHFQQDVDRFAAWGFDAVKGDFCGAYGLRLDPRTEFTAFADAIARDRPHRRMILYVGNGDTWSRNYAYTAFDDWAWAPRIAASWRTDDDLSYPDTLSWGHVLRNIDADARHPEAAGHGHWNDPDYLAPSLLPADQARAQFTMWAVLAAPMMVSADVAALAPSTIAMLTNRQVLAISQDRLGRQGVAVLRRGSLQIWVKPLADGGRGVAILNRGHRTARITFSASRIGLGGSRFLVRHVWAGWAQRTSRLDFRVAGTSALLLRIRPA